MHRILIVTRYVFLSTMAASHRPVERRILSCRVLRIFTSSMERVADMLHRLLAIGMCLPPVNSSV